MILRGILGVVVGFIALAIVLFVLFTIVWFVLGAEGSYKPELWEVSTTWLIISFAVGLIAAIVGGAVCKLIAKKMTAVWVMCGVFLLCSAITAFAQLAPSESTDEKTARPDNVKITDAMQNAEQPMIAYIVNPILGVAGILIGAKLVGGRASAQAPPPAE